jgi:hypothetical protein
VLALARARLRTSRTSRTPAHTRLRTHALAHVAHAHVAQGRLDSFGRVDQSGFVDGGKAGDRAGKQFRSPAL